MPVMNAKFSTFQDGGDLELTDIVVGLRDGVNTKFTFNGVADTYLELDGGTMRGAIDMDGNVITGLPLPTNPTDSASKAYVDSITAPVGAVGTIQRSNGTNWVPSTATYPDTVALGDIFYGSATNVIGNLVGNITTSKLYLSQTGTGAVSAAPAWSAISGADITGAALTKADDTNVTLTLGGTPATALLRATSITAGWTGVLSLARGGTNKAIVADVGALVYCDADSFELLAATATAGQIPRSGANAAPTWSTATYPDTAGAIGNLMTSDGTNWLSSPAAGVGSPLTTKGDLYTFSTVNTRLAVGTVNGQILQVNSADATGLSWSTATFASTYAINSILFASAADTVTALAPANRAVLTSGATGVPVMTPLATDGQLIIGSTAGVPAAATLTPGTGISIANAGNSITISATGGGFGVAGIAGTSQAAAVNTMYIALNAGQTTLTLPAVFAFGDSIRLLGGTANTGGWIITAAAGDTIIYNGSTTSAGGTLTSSALAGMAVELVADVANSSWVAASNVSTTLTTA